MLQTCENQFYQGKHPICQTSEKPKSAANIRKPALSWRTSDMPNIRKTKKCCKHPKSSFSRANIRYVRHPKNQKVLHTSENQLYHAKHPICQTSEKPKSAANIRKAAFPGQTSDMSNIRKTKKCCKHAKTSFTRANIRFVKHSKTKKCCKHPKSSFTRANIRYVKHSKTKKCCKHPKSSFARADIRYVKHPKKQKVLQTSEKQLFHGKHPKCQTSEKPKSAANIRKPALSWRTSDMPNIRKTKKCCKHPKSSFSRANIRYVRHPKNQKVLQTSEKQLFQGKLPICQTFEKPKSAAIMQKPALPGQTSDTSNIQKLKSAANIRKAAFPGQTSDVSNIRKIKNCCKPAKTSLTRANIRYVKHLKNQKVLQTSENQLYHGEHPICQISEKSKSAANIRKAAFPGQTSNMSDIRRTKKCCIHAKTSFTRANIRYVKHPKNQKKLQLSGNQLYHGKHPICQTSEKPKSAANIRKAAFPGQTSDMSNIRKTKKCCNYAKTSFTRANIRYVKHSKTKKCCKHPKSSFSRANI